MPGVLAVLTGQDWIDAGLGVLPIAWSVYMRGGQSPNEVHRPVLTPDRARHVGDTLAVVVAEHHHQALDAAEAIEFDFEVLPAVTTFAEAMDASAPLLHDNDRATNLVFDWDCGREAEADAALANAHHIAEIDLINNRLVPNALEPRAVVAYYDAGNDRYTLWSASQGPHVLRRWISKDSLFIPEHKLRVIAPDVGGGFGNKYFHFPEEALVLWTAKLTRQPVRWTCTRSEVFLVDTHSRDHVTKGRMAFDADGNILGLHVDTRVNLGAYQSHYGASIPTYFYAPLLGGQYKIPAIFCRVRGAYTNTTPVDSYRGAGRPEASYVTERLIENGAREMGIDVCDMRLRNLLQPEDFPYSSPIDIVLQEADGSESTGSPTYDIGDYPSLMTTAKSVADYQALRAEQLRLRSDGVLMGIGLSAYVESTGCGPSMYLPKIAGRHGGWDMASIRVHPTGTVTLLVGCQNHGQGQETTFAQIAADRLTCDINDIDYVQGDTDRLPFGTGTWASRSTTVIGTAVVMAAERIIVKCKTLAAHLLECSADDLELRDGVFYVKGTDRQLSFADVAEAAYDGFDYPDGFELGLEETAFYDPTAYNYPSGTHVAVVKVDADTGRVELRDYFAVDDFGQIINPISPLIKWLFFGSYPQMRNAAAKAVWPLCEPPRATIMAPVGLSRTKIPPYPPATASRGVPAPMSWRISNDRLWPATWSRYRLCTFSRPRSQVRRMPPRSRLWAKQRSTISARSLKASRATPDLSRARLLVTARRAASSPCQREKPVCLGAAIRVFQGLSFRALKTARE